jgi:hypothetical protein
MNADNRRWAETQKKPQDPEGSFAPKPPGRPQKDVFFNPVVLNIAQITGFIIVGIIMAALLVLLFVWCSQPLWALSDRRPRPAEQKMYGAQSGPVQAKGRHDLSQR